MNPIKRYTAIFLAVALCGLSLMSCNDDESGHRPLKQYLYDRALEAQELIDTTIEGDEEGEYTDGAHAYLQAVVDRALQIYWDRSVSQKDVDDFYYRLEDEMENFGDMMNPYFSEMDALISNARTVVVNTSIGPGEGQIPSQGDKDALNAAIQQAERFMADTEGVTQRLLDEAMGALRIELYAFEGKIPGLMNIFIENHSFELPDMDGQIRDFDLIPGWNYEGWMDGINEWSSLGQKATGTYKRADGWWMTGGDAKEASDGERMLTLHVYSKPVWQLLDEGLHTTSRYTLSLMMARFSSSSRDNTGFRMQLIVFTGKPGDFNNVEVLKEYYHTDIASLSYNDFVPQQLILDVPASHEYTGKRMAITMRSYYMVASNSTSDPNWAWPSSENLGVVVDNVTLTREKREEQQQ